MAKKRRVRIKTEGEIALEIARSVIEGRAKLRALMQQEVLSPAQKQKAITLIDEIEKAKEAIRDLGFNPKSTVIGAAAAMRKEEIKTNTKKLNRKLGRRKGGVGMYGLGSSVKSWR